MPNPWILLAIILSWCATVGGAGYYEYGVGKTEDSAAWQAKNNAQLAAYNAKILQMETADRELTTQREQQFSIIAAQAEKEKSDELTQKDAVIAQLRSGALQLHDPYGSTPHDSSANKGGFIATSAGGSDDTATGQLSEPTSEFLVNQASRADQIVIQLQKCQVVVIADRDPLKQK